MRTPKLFQSLFKSTHTTTTRLKVEGMTCSGCAARVEKAIRALPGVASADADLPASHATVVHDPSKISPDRIRQAILAAGYKVGDSA
jgi:copper chaperone CopZ